MILRTPLLAHAPPEAPSPALLAVSLLLAAALLLGLLTLAG
jgi:hypothetical protein